ncbi:hypothetical protein DL769_010644 [Monosporascus sp. CRB-8-3]|nr:hypothetical protein DL769_010644 [Monosporascus sp. CRB-8-3]
MPPVVSVQKPAVPPYSYRISRRVCQSKMIRSLLVAALAATASALPIMAREKLYTIELAPGVTEVVTLAGKEQLKKEGKNFLDITNHPNLSSSTTSASARPAKAAAAAFPEGVAFADDVRALIGTLNRTNLETSLKTYSDFETRYYRSETGLEAARWLLDQVRATVEASGVEGASAEPFEHADFDQISVIARIPGKSASAVVVGAHLDSINGADIFGRSPGADDNGSGTVTLLEALRVVLSDPKVAAGEHENTIEFHWYAAEEAGLLGSADIFDQYAAEGVDVKAYLNQDMTGWAPPGEAGEFGVILDYVDEGLTGFTRLVLDAYTTIPAVDTRCGYACSDHASARAAGYPAAFIFEAAADNTSPYIHTADDAYDTISFDHVMEHARLVVGFVYELAFATL